MFEYHLENGRASLRYQTFPPKAGKKSPKYLYAWSEVGLEGRYRKPNDSGELFIELQGIYAKSSLGEPYFNPFKRCMAFFERPWTRKELHHPWISG
jgi:hypothetical protein